MKLFKKYNILDNTSDQSELSNLDSTTSEDQKNSHYFKIDKMIIIGKKPFYYSVYTININLIDDDDQSENSIQKINETSSCAYSIYKHTVVKINQNFIKKIIKNNKILEFAISTNKSKHLNISLVEKFLHLDMFICAMCSHSTDYIAQSIFQIYKNQFVCFHRIKGSSNSCIWYQFHDHK